MEQKKPELYWHSCPGCEGFTEPIETGIEFMGNDHEPPYLKTYKCPDCDYDFGACDWTNTYFREKISLRGNS